MRERRAKRRVWRRPEFGAGETFSAHAENRLSPQVDVSSEHIPRGALVESACRTESLSRAQSIFKSAIWHDTTSHSWQPVTSVPMDLRLGYCHPVFFYDPNHSDLRDDMVESTVITLLVTLVRFRNM